MTGGRAVRPGRPRQVDIARRLGVSQATVSLVLSGRGDSVGIARETVERIEEAARDAGYVRDVVAARLARKQNRLIGVHTFNPTFPVGSETAYLPFLVGLERGAAERGHDLLLFTGSTGTAGAVGESARREREARLDRLRLADGCILFGRVFPADDLAMLVARGLPLVHLGRVDVTGLDIPYVGADYVSASREVIEHLVSVGHTEIVYVRENDDAPASQDRERGVLDGLAGSGVPIRPVLRVSSDQLTPEWLSDLVRGGVTAFVVETTDESPVARRLAALIRSSGLRCPEDISFALLGRAPVGLGDDDTAGFAAPSDEMSGRAIDLLIDLVRGVEIPAAERHVLLPCRVITGGTVGPRRAAS